MNTRAALALLGSLLLTAAALGDARSDGDLRALRPDTALLLLPIRSNGEAERLEFRDAARDTSFTIDDIEDRAQLVLLKVAPGTYYLDKVTLADRSEYRFAAQERYAAKFELRGGTLNYAGDLLLEFDKQRLRAALAGNVLDALPTMLRLEPDLEADLFERFPLALLPPLSGATLSGREPDPTWRLADWFAHAPMAQAARHGALASATLTHFGVAMPALGTGFAEARTALERLPKRRAEVSANAPRQQLFVELDGMWGEHGQALGIEFLFVAQKLVHVAVRGKANGGLWGIPDADAWDDLSAITAAK